MSKGFVLNLLEHVFYGKSGFSSQPDLDGKNSSTNSKCLVRNTRGKEVFI